MDLKTITDTALDPALALLPAAMDTPAAAAWAGIVSNLTGGKG